MCLVPEAAEVQHRIGDAMLEGNCIGEWGVIRTSGRAKCDQILFRLCAGDADTSMGRPSAWLLGLPLVYSAVTGEIFCHEDTRSVRWSSWIGHVLVSASKLCTKAVQHGHGMQDSFCSNRCNTRRDPRERETP